MRFAVIRPGQTDLDQKWIKNLFWDGVELCDSEDDAFEFPKGTLQSVEEAINRFGFKLTEVGLTKVRDDRGNSPAFPIAHSLATPYNGFASPYGFPALQSGLTKREYFAALAMQAIVSTQTRDMIESDYWSASDRIAKDAVNYADALIAELGKPLEDTAIDSNTK